MSCERCERLRRREDEADDEYLRMLKSGARAERERNRYKAILVAFERHLAWHARQAPPDLLHPFGRCVCMSSGRLYCPACVASGARRVQRG